MTTSRARLLFRISLVSVVGGVLTALGALVLLQQAGSVYPTQLVTALAVVLGVVWGVAIPSLARTLGARRLDR